MIGLVDGNNFFVSCERIFNRRLVGRPVAVLSNNDGCCVSQSNEFKALGIPMGTPYYQLKDRGRPGILTSARQLRTLRRHVPGASSPSCGRCLGRWTPAHGQTVWLPHHHGEKPPGHQQQRRPLHWRDCAPPHGHRTARPGLQGRPRRRRFDAIHSFCYSIHTFHTLL